MSFSSCKQVDENPNIEYLFTDTLTDQALPAEVIVYSDIKENESETNNSETDDSRTDTLLNYSDQENKEKSKEEVRTLTCKHCNENFTQKKVSINVLGRNYENWSGGTNHCDPNWSSSDLSKNINWSEKSKYCSRKCACNASED